MIIVEGIMALYHEPVRELFDMKIFVDTVSKRTTARIFSTFFFFFHRILIHAWLVEFVVTLPKEDEL